MRSAPFVLGLCLLVSAPALAMGEFGPPEGFPNGGEAMRLRVGLSSNADVEALQIVVSINRTGQRRLRAFYLRTGQELAQGQWRIEVRDEVGNLLPGADFVVTLQPESWNEIVLPQPSWVPSTPATGAQAVAATIRVSPVGNAETEFRVWTRLQAWADVLYGGSYGLDTGRLLSQYTWPKRADAGSYSGAVLRPDGGLIDFPAQSVIVLETNDRPGPFTPSACAANATEVSGNPYFEVVTQTADAGGMLTETFGHVFEAMDEDIRVGGFSFAAPGSQPSSTQFELRHEQTLSASGAVGLGLSSVTTPYSCFPVPAADAGTNSIAIVATSAPVSLYALSAGDGLGLCDAPARATWGGSGFSFNGDPGRDLLFSAGGGPLSSFYADGDQDGYGDPSTSVKTCLPPTSYVSNHDDCDDTNAQVNPGAAEVCDGIDNNCNGTTDDADGWLTRPLCELTAGVCQGARHSGAQCIADGGWQPCTAAEYGPSYQSVEPPACDGVDNDCDGVADSAVLCALQLGVCAGATYDLCTVFDAGCFTAEYGPDFQAEETRCDGLDNDCDGLIDETCDAGFDAGSEPDAGEPALIDGGDADAGSIAQPSPPPPPKSCGCTETTGLESAAALLIALAARARNRRRPAA